MTEFKEYDPGPNPPWRWSMLVLELIILVVAGSAFLFFH